MVDHLFKYHNWKHYSKQKNINDDFTSLNRTFTQLKNSPQKDSNKYSVDCKSWLFFCSLFKYKTTEVTRVLLASSPPLRTPLRPSFSLLIRLRCRDAEMLRKALQEANLMFLMFLMSPHPRWAACWLVSKLVAKKGQRLQDAVTAAGGGGGGGGWEDGGGRGWWIAWSCSLYPDAQGRMDAFDCCTDVEQTLDGGTASLLARYSQQTHWHHRRDVRKANGWVPNWNSDFWWIEVALTFNPGPLTKVKRDDWPFFTASNNYLTPNWFQNEAFRVFFGSFLLRE